MERVYKEKSLKKQGGGIKDRPQCERCGRPVKVNSEDYIQEEILCTACASDARSSRSEDEE